MADRIQMRRDTLANWSAYNPILLEGEQGYVLDDANLFKMGDGVHAWNDLPWRGYNGNILQEVEEGVDNAVPSSNAIAKVLKTKVDKEEGKSLIPEQYIQETDNPEFMHFETDSEGKIAQGIRNDGTNIIGGNMQVGGNASVKGDFDVIGTMRVAGVICKVIKSQEFLAAWMDNSDKVIFGIKNDGKTYVGDADFLYAIKSNKKEIDAIKAMIPDSIDWDALNSFRVIDNPEFMHFETDSEGKITSGRRTNGIMFEKVGFETPMLDIDGNTVKDVYDLEKRIEIKTDAENKIFSYRDSDGVLHEKVGIAPNSLILNKRSTEDIKSAFSKYGLKIENPSDFSDYEYIELPIPRTIAIVTINSLRLPKSKTDNIIATMEYLDKDGNYFRKPIVLNSQGNSTLTYIRADGSCGNLAIDITDGSSIKFAHWVAQDSFHLKKDYVDIFRGKRVVGYRWMEEIYQSRPFGRRKPWEYLNDDSSIINGSGSVKKDFNTGALAHPDGFPILIYWNNGLEVRNMGIYSVNLKKHRDNYYAKKDNAKNIILDGNLGANTIWNGAIDWTAFEIRNPKSLKLVDGGKYDGDNPQEITGDSAVDATSAKVKQYIQRLSNACAAITANMTKAKFEEYFMADFFIDWYIMSQVTYNIDGFAYNWIWCTWDGNIWAPTAYDLDCIFGTYGNITMCDSTQGIIDKIPTNLLSELYSAEIANRYQELRNLGIIDKDHIIKMLEDWLDCIGYDNIKNEVEMYPETPSYRDGYIGEGWQVVAQVSIATPDRYPRSEYNENTTYNKGQYVSYNGIVFECTQDGLTGVSPITKFYDFPPVQLGFYDSIQRTYNWLSERISYLDSVYNYNQN